MAQLFFVYLLTFSNGKVYVGMSRTCAKGLFTTRYRRHTYAANSGKLSPLYNAWRKHGAPIQQVLSVHATRAQCAAAEIDAIQANDGMNPESGYNLQPGGQGLHAPPGSSIYELMRVKVWDNPEWRRKLSAALKGRPVSAETRAAHAEWIQSSEAKALIAEVARRPEVRAGASARMRRRLEDPAYRAWLSTHQEGKPKNISEDGKARIAAGRTAYINSEAGKEGARRGARAMRADPQNEAKRRAAHNAYLHSDANEKHCRAMAANNVKAVTDLATGRSYPSQKAAAEALGVSRPTINYWVRTGKFERVS
jgi:hypothetical protein